jgi:hypothetical protein
MPNYIVNRNAQFDSGDHEVHVTPGSACKSPRYPTGMDLTDKCQVSPEGGQSLSGDRGPFGCLG